MYLFYFLRIDYVSGNLGGESVGHQVRGSLIPLTSIDTSFPVIRRSSTAAQTANGYSSSVVGTNNVGFSDNSVTIDSSRVAANAYGTPSAIVRIVEPVKITTPVYNSANPERSTMGSSYRIPTVALRTPVAPTYSSPTSVIDVARIFESAPAYSSPPSSSSSRSPNVGSYGQQNNVFVFRTPQPPASSSTSYESTGKFDSFLSNLVAGGRINSNSKSYDQQEISEVVVKGLASNSGSTGKAVTFQDDRLYQY